MMTNISLSHELTSRGVTKPELARLVRANELTRIRRGAYAEPLADGAAPEQVHLALVRATVRQVSAAAVVSHASAAVVHGLPTWSEQLGRVHLTRDRPGGGKRRHNLQVHGLPLAESEVVTVDGMRVTSLARTVLDLSCASSLDRAVVVGDAALRQGLVPAILQQAVQQAVGRHGIGRARCALMLFDGRSESPGESMSRVLFWRHGLPRPELQLEVRAADGRLVGRCDFGWEDRRTLGEFDGRAKYGRLLAPGRTGGDAVYTEKLREDALRDLEWQVVRWTWADLAEPAALLARLERAFARGRRSA